jgi:hypothetical protein
LSEDKEPGKDAGTGGETGEFWGRLTCGIGLLLAGGGIVAALLGSGASVAPGAVGVGLGILGYFLGANRLGTLTIILSTAVIFFGLAASQGLIPGIGQSDRDLPAREPSAEDN